MSTKSTGLGKGLDSLIPQDFDESLLVDKGERIQKIPINAIQPNPNQPRRHFDEGALKELADSIKQHGLLQPIVVTPVKNGSYAIIAGERRWRSARLAGLASLPAIVRSAEELDQLEIALVENVQRVDLSPLEQALSIVRLHEQFNMDYATIGKRLGKAASTVHNIARLLGLPEPARQALAEGKISEGHARSILALKDQAKQLELLGLIIKNGWTVRQAESFVIAHRQGHASTERAQARTRATTPETDRLGQQLKTKVTVWRTARGGRLEIAFESDEDLKRLLAELSR